MTSFVRMRRFGVLVAIVVAAGCGPPVLRNAPRPAPAVVAGVAAAAAAAATLAAPAAAAKRQEERRDEPDNRGMEVRETVPPDVFDRLDRADAGVDGP
jgi:hypothetical protein